MGLFICGQVKLPRTDQDGGSYSSSAGCYSAMNATNMFYLSLENAVCQDYVTEKELTIASMEPRKGTDSVLCES